MTEQTDNKDYSLVIESFRTCADAANSFTREYRKLFKAFNTLQSTLSTMEDNSLQAAGVIKSISKSAKTINTLSDSIPELAEKLKDVTGAIEGAGDIYENSLEKIKEFGENTEELKEITDELKTFSEIADKFDPDKFKDSFTEVNKQTSEAVSSYTQSIESFKNQIADYRKSIKEMNTNIKNSSKSLKDFTKKTDTEIKELKKIAEERADFNFDTTVVLKEDLLTEIIEKATKSIKKEFELLKQDDRYNKVFVTEEILNQFVEKATKGVEERLLSSSYKEKFMNEELIKSVITSVIDKFEEARKKDEEVEKAEITIKEEKKKEQFDDFKEEINASVSKLLNKKLEDNKEEIAEQVSEAISKISKVKTEKGETTADIIKNFTRLLSAQQQAFLDGMKDIVKNDVAEALEKKLVELKLVPEIPVELYTLQMLLDMHKKFPFNTIDHTDGNKTVFQIRKFDEHGHAAYSVYLEDDKKVKSTATLNINDKKYEFLG
ncbi:MAG: hypothetical protein J7L77_01705 [Clostridiales bacterium]|nr:hypothetical protein [Clostridiales bacterium]